MVELNLALGVMLGWRIPHVSAALQDRKFRWMPQDGATAARQAKWTFWGNVSCYPCNRSYNYHDFKLPIYIAIYVCNTRF